ncbi:MAG: hypothetical protein NVS3B1_22070 [Marmoricola sp.]
MPKLIALGTTLTENQARSAICHGTVYIGAENIDYSRMEVERQVLAGSTVRAGRQEFQVNALATGIVRKDPRCRLPC